MVIDQGTMLDRIDYNVENMAVNVKAADKELNVVRTSHPTPGIKSGTDGTIVGNGLSTQVHETEDPVSALSSRHRHVYSSPGQTEAIKRSSSTSVSGQR